ncbi:hypothetical protein BST61_g11201 [Cercospora zeina]
MTINVPGTPRTQLMAQRYSIGSPPNMPLMSGCNSSMPLSPPVTPEHEHLPRSSLPYRPERILETKSVRISIDLTGRPSATYSVLRNQKLLENILYYVNSRTLLHCPRVNRFWLELIINSPALRRHLWIDPPPQPPGRNPKPYLNPFLATFRSNLAINAFVKREYSDATDYVLRFARKSKLLYLGGGSWRDMMVFLPSERAAGTLTVQVEDDDVPCVYDVIPIEMDWSQEVKMGALVDLILAG